MFISNIQLKDIISSSFTCKKSQLLSSPKCIIYRSIHKSVTDFFEAFVKSLFFIPSDSLCWNKMHESSAYKSKVDLTACGISVT